MHQYVRRTAKENRRCFFEAGIGPHIKHYLQQSLILFYDNSAALYGQGNRTKEHSSRTGVRPPVDVCGNPE
ncbi:hypothetical protein FRB94_005894 [Tulasnella sp. JGI-2019a]|nr:hypothetical protein FRB93_008211 [Tulasnella sp. JGI-2019a]KAG8999836.1 hypothetical protein FRB94_005894 [Tulasnella sp. JGI-2019a]